MGRHGDRWEERTLWTSTALNEYLDWPQVRQVCCVERRVTRKGVTSKELAYAVMVETPFRAAPEDIALVRMGVELMTELTGCASHAVVAWVVRDSSAEADIASGQVNWHFIERGELEAE